MQGLGSKTRRARSKATTMAKPYGPLLFPLLVVGTIRSGIEGYKRGNGVLVLLTTAAVVPFLVMLWRSTEQPVLVNWPIGIWPPAIVATAIYLEVLVQQHDRSKQLTMRWVVNSLAIGLGIVLSAISYNVFDTRSLFGKIDPIVQEAGYGKVSTQALAFMRKIGATWIATTDYTTCAMLRWELRDQVPILQINERSDTWIFACLISGALKVGWD